MLLHVSTVVGVHKINDTFILLSSLCPIKQSEKTSGITLIVPLFIDSKEEHAAYHARCQALIELSKYSKYFIVADKNKTS